MDLTPEMLRTVEFNDAKKGGYDHDEVDDFLDRAAADLARQHTALRDLEARVTAAEQRAAEAESAANDRSDSDETLRRTLVLAQRTADAAIKEANDDAARIVAEARQKADGLVASAEEQVRREVGATRDRLQAEIRELEGRRGQLHERITDLGAHLDAERDRLRSQVDELRRSLDDDALRLTPVPGVDPEPVADTPLVDVSASDAAAPLATDPEGQTAADVDVVEPDAEELSDLPPPPADWSAAEEPAERGSLLGSDDDLDGGPPTQATPVVGGAGDVGSSHLDELRRAVSDGPAEPGADEDAAMAAFFDQDDDDEPSRRFGRRR